MYSNVLFSQAKLHPYVVKSSVEKRSSAEFSEA